MFSVSITFPYPVRVIEKGLPDGLQALAQPAGMALEMSRLYRGQKEAIDILKQMREAKKTSRGRRMTPFEGIPVSYPLGSRRIKSA